MLSTTHAAPRRESPFMETPPLEIILKSSRIHVDDNISRLKAIEILQGKAVGTHLIRNSSQQDQRVISFVSTKKEIEHLLFTEKKDGEIVCNPNTYPNLDTFIVRAISLSSN